MQRHPPAGETLVDPLTRFDTASRRLLIIEDYPPFRLMLVHLLRAAGYAVDEAEDGPAGLASHRIHPADLVITDRDMPGLNGWEVARLLKSMKPGLPVILVTGGIDAGATGQRDFACVDAILLKPFSFSELLVLIRQLTSNARATATPAAGSKLRRSLAWPLS